MALDPIVPAAVVGTVLLFAATKKKKKKAKGGGAGGGNGGRTPGSGGPGDNGNGGGGRLPGGGKPPKGSDDVDPWEQCPEGWFEENGEIVCQDLTIEDDDVEVDPQDVFISDDCQELIEGDDWFEEVFVPTGVEWIDYDFENFGAVVYLMRQLLTLPDPDTEEPWVEPECIASWPPFVALVDDYPGGPMDTETEAGYQAWLDAWEAHEVAYPVVNAWLADVESRALAHSVLGTYLKGWIDTYAGTDWSFDPGCGEELGIPCA